MAAAVLGKRSRRHLDEDDISTALPVTKRRTRRSTPQIYEDSPPDSEQERRHTCAQKKTFAPKNGLVRSRNERTKRIVKTTSAAKDDTASPPVEDQAVSVSDENVPPSAVSTPSTNRFKDALAPCTPKHRVRLAGRLLTPRSSRSSTPQRLPNVYAQARQVFTQANHGRIIGRGAERSQLTKFIATALEKRVGGCMYVSGPPGTGKSALVQETMAAFHDQPAKTAVINCVALKTASEVLSKLSEVLGLSTAKTPLKSTLAQLFTSQQGPAEMHLVLLDEIDTLVGADCDILYSIFEWAMHPTSSLILVGIANALDLTDRFLPRLKARHLGPQMLPFLPYSAQQISSIISEKLRGLLPEDTTAAAEFVPLMHPAAIQLSGKKIAAQTGDLRKAFGLVRRAIDQVEQETLLKLTREQTTTPTKQPLAEIPNAGRPDHAAPDQARATKIGERSVLCQLTVETAPRASIAHVAKIAATIFNNGTISRLGGLNLQQKAVLCSLVAAEKFHDRRDPYTTPSKSWSKVPTIKALFQRYGQLCQRDDGLLQPLKNTEFRDVVASLETLGLIQEATGRNSSLLTPTNTPSRSGRAMDDKQVVSAVSHKEMKDSLTGLGSDLLLRLLDEE